MHGQSALQNRTERIQIGHLLEQAKYHMSQASASINGRHASPAAAFWEYLVAYKLVAEAIPAHKDYIDRVETTRGQLHRDFNQVLKVRFVISIQLYMELIQAGNRGKGRKISEY